MGAPGIVRICVCCLKSVVTSLLMQIFIALASFFVSVTPGYHWFDWAFFVHLKHDFQPAVAFVVPEQGLNGSSTYSEVP